jgi:hypothetical protein
MIPRDRLQRCSGQGVRGLFGRGRWRCAGLSDSSWRWLLVQEIVERVLRGCCAVFGAGADDIALGSGHGFVAKELHERIHADVGVGQLGGIGVSEGMHESSWGALSVGAGELEGP